MSHNKRDYPVLLHHLILVGVILSSAVPVSALSDPLKGSTEVEFNNVRMMSGVVVALLDRGLDVFHPERNIPNGFEYAGRLLEPSRTVLYGDRSFLQKTNSNPELIRAEEQLTRVVYLRFDGPVDPTRAAAQLMKDARIAHAEPWYVGELHADPNDPLFSQQASLNTMQMSQAWDIETGSGDIVIGISDNGVDQAHEDLSGALWTNTGEIPDNGIDDDNNGFIDDYRGCNFSYKDDGTDPGNTANPRAGGHGTKVAGIAGASTNNGVGMAGAGNKSKIFPMKTARRDGGGIIYGYQSLIYSADMGFDVVNASWGIVKPPSPIDISVVNYCLAKGLVIVASAGNHGTGLSGDGWAYLNFPSAYDGVLGVGETDSQDKVIQSSGLGINASVMAPGNRTVATNSGGGYSSTNISGTSFASPLAAGVAALVTSRFPSLTPRQVMAHLRRTGDNIWGNNPAYSSVLSNRVNGLKAVSTDPMSQPALRISSVQRRHTDGSPAERFAAGDTLLIDYVVTNDLGTTGEMTFTVGIAEENGWSVTVLDDMVQTEAIMSGASSQVGQFKVVVSSFSDLPLMLGLLCEDSGNYRESLLDYLPAPGSMTTISNQSLAYSVGDDGTIGFSNNLSTRQGIGFNWLAGYWLLSPSGFLFTEGGNRVLKAYNNVTNQSEFTPEKPFAEPERNRGVMTDANAAQDRRVGVKVHQRFTFPSPTSQTTVISVSIENRSLEDLNDVAGGYFLDWDVGYAGQDNITRLAPEALPTTFRELGAAQLFDRANVDAAVVCAVVCTEADFQTQSAGMMLSDYVDDGDGLTDDDVLTLLSSGTSIQTTSIGDACGVLGIKFPGVLGPGSRKSFMVVIGVAATASEASDLVRETILEPNSVNETAPIVNSVRPNPASSRITIDHEPSVKNISIVNTLGVVVNSMPIEIGSTYSELDVSALSVGSYFVVLRSGDQTETRTVVVVR